MADKSKIKLIAKIVAIIAAVSMVVSMVLMFTGLLSPFIAMPIAVASPGIGIIASFIEKWDWQGMSGFKKVFLIVQLLFISGLSIVGLIELFTRYYQQ